MLLEIRRCIRTTKCKSPTKKAEPLGNQLSANIKLRFVVWGRKPFPTEPPSATPKPDHWPQEPTSDDEGDDDDDDNATIA